VAQSPAGAPRNAANGRASEPEAPGRAASTGGPPDDVLSGLVR
jgi:hypothetical protein